MPVENLEEQGLEKNPDLHLAQLKFKLTLSDFKNDAAIKDELMQAIEKDSKALSLLVFLHPSFVKFGNSWVFMLPKS